MMGGSQLLVPVQGFTDTRFGADFNKTNTRFDGSYKVTSKCKNETMNENGSTTN